MMVTVMVLILTFTNRYWGYDWADSHSPILSLDKTSKSFVIPQPSYGIKLGQRYYYYNILEELDSPGEWYSTNLIDATLLIFF